MTKTSPAVPYFSLARVERIFNWLEVPPAGQAGTTQVGSYWNPGNRRKARLGLRQDVIELDITVSADWIPCPPFRRHHYITSRLNPMSTSRFPATPLYHWAAPTESHVHLSGDITVSADWIPCPPQFQATSLYRPTQLNPMSTFPATWQDSH